MQVQPRVGNVFMPQGTADKTNAPTPLYAPGELGVVFSDQNVGGIYRRVLLDSGATASSAVGAVAAGQVAFWKDRANYIVTNDKNQCDVGPSGAINRVAGIFQLAVTTAPGTTGPDGLPQGYYCDVVVQKKSMQVAATGTLVPGAVAIVDTTASVSRVISASTVTTAPISQVIGTVTSATLATGNFATVDVNIGFQD